MIIHHQKLAFIHIRKNAGCAITHLLLTNALKHETTGAICALPQNIRDTYELNYNLKHASALKLKEHLHEDMWNDYYKFACVRNPWDRTVSSYHWIKSKEKLHDLSFNKYVNLMYKHKDDKSHKFSHMFQPQSSFITSPNGEIIIDYVIQFEKIQEGIDNVSSSIGINLGTIKKHNVTSHHKHYRKYYTTETQDMVHECYADDVQLFDYKF